jgi:tRNA-Thr(GGU) m(6)t(6)A37 methyltransferase TsaA
MESDNAWTVRAIGYVHSPFSESQQVPRGLGAKHEEEGVLEILPEFELGLQDIDGFSHLYILWLFDRSESSELVGTPPCDTHPHGVFASRSPRRPNLIGLTVVRLLGRDGNRLRVRGVDMLEGTPILDIKPYLSNVSDSELKRGWLAEAEARRDASRS